MVTVVITTYKREPKMVERALKSVLNQTYKDLEIIVVDDSPSTYEMRNSVAKLIRSYEEQGVIYTPHKKNQGACAARNTGLNYAHGEYIAYLDDDDEWEKEKIEKQVKKFLTCSSDTALVYCGKYFVNDSTGEVREERTPFSRGNIFGELISGKNFVGSTSYPLIRTECLRKIGGFDINMPASQDFDVWLRLALKYQMDYVEEPLVRYHVHEGECITGDLKKKIIAMKLINEKHKDYLDTHKDAKWRRQMVFVPRYSANGNYVKALSIWFSSVLLQPTKIKESISYLYRAAASAKFRGKR